MAITICPSSTNLATISQIISARILNSVFSIAGPCQEDCLQGHCNAKIVTELKWTYAVCYPHTWTLSSHSSVMYCPRYSRCKDDLHIQCTVTLSCEAEKKLDTERLSELPKVTWEVWDSTEANPYLLNASSCLSSFEWELSMCCLF